jgi:predicted nucleic acid-binding protein
MRVVLHTNILVSALIAPAGNPAAIYNAWEQVKFTLLTCTEHLDEVREPTHQFASFLCKHFTVQNYAAAVWTEQPKQETDCGRLPSAVRT